MLTEDERAQEAEEINKALGIKAEAGDIRLDFGIAPERAEQLNVGGPGRIQSRRSSATFRPPGLGEFLRASLFALFGHQPLTPLQSGSRHLIELLTLTTCGRPRDAASRQRRSDMPHVS
jgi:hypothetical protein